MFSLKNQSHTLFEKAKLLVTFKFYRNLLNWLGGKKLSKYCIECGNELPDEAKFCVIFISQYYKDKLWTNHERKSAQSRALKENREYILPVKLDDTEIPGIRETVGYIDLRETSVEDLADITIKKLNTL